MLVWIEKKLHVFHILKKAVQSWSTASTMSISDPGNICLNALLDPPCCYHLMAQDACFSSVVRHSSGLQQQEGGEGRRTQLLPFLRHLRNCTYHLRLYLARISSRGHTLALANTSSIMLKTSGERGCSCLVDHSEKAFSFSLSTMLTVILVQVLYPVKEVPISSYTLAEYSIVSDC